MSRLPLAPFEKILKDLDARIRVSEPAAKAMAEAVEELARALGTEAIALARHAGRKTVMAEDVKFAAKRKQ